MRVELLREIYVVGTLILLRSRKSYQTSEDLINVQLFLPCPALMLQRGRLWFQLGE